MLDLAPYAVHPGDRITLRGAAVPVTGKPEAARDPVGRRVIILPVTRPDTGEADVAVCDPAAPVMVRRPVLEGEGPRHLKVTAADGTVSYRTVHDDTDQAAVVSEARDAGSSVEETESSGLEHAPGTARSLHRLAAARGWNTTWTPDGHRGGLLLADHPDNIDLQIAQGWKDGRKLAGSEEYDFGPLGESRDLITANPGRVPGQTAGEIAAAKITGTRVPVAAAAGMPAGRLEAACRELARQAALTGSDVTGRHQIVKDEAARRAAQDLPVHVRAAAHASAARQLAADLRGEYTDRAGLDRESGTPDLIQAHARDMLKAAGQLEEAARQFDEEDERAAITTVAHAGRTAGASAYGIRDAAVAGPAATRPAGAETRRISEQMTSRISDLHTAMSRELPLTDADGRQVRVGDTVHVLEGKHAGTDWTVTGFDTFTAGNIPPATIRLARRAEENIPGRGPRGGAPGPGTPGPPVPAAVRPPRHAVTTDADGRQGWHSVHGDEQWRELQAHADRHGMTVTSGEPGSGDLPRTAREFRDHALATGWDVSAYKGTRPGGRHVHMVTATNPDGNRKVTRHWDGNRAVRGSRTLAEDKRQVSAHPRWEHVPGGEAVQVRRTGETADATGATGTAGHLEAAAAAAAGGNTALAVAELRAAEALIPAGRPESGLLRERVTRHLNTIGGGIPPGGQDRAREAGEPGQAAAGPAGSGQAWEEARSRARRASLAEASGITPGSLPGEQALAGATAFVRDAVRDAETWLLRQDFDAAGGALTWAIRENRPPQRQRQAGQPGTGTAAAALEDARAVIRAAAAQRRDVPPMLAAVTTTMRYPADGSTAVLAVDQKDREYQLWLDPAAGTVSVTRAGQTLTRKATGKTSGRAARQLAGKLVGENHPVPARPLPAPKPKPDPGRAPAKSLTRTEQLRQPVVDEHGRVDGAGDRESAETRLHLDNAAAALAAGDTAKAGEHLAAAQFAMPGGSGDLLFRRIQNQRARLAGGKLPRLRPGQERVVASGTHDGVHWTAVERRPEDAHGIIYCCRLKDTATGRETRTTRPVGPLKAASDWKREAARQAREAEHAEYRWLRGQEEVSRIEAGKTAAAYAPDRLEYGQVEAAWLAGNPGGRVTPSQRRYWAYNGPSPADQRSDWYQAGVAAKLAGQPMTAVPDHLHAGELDQYAGQAAAPGSPVEHQLHTAARALRDADHAAAVTGLLAARELAAQARTALPGGRAVPSRITRHIARITARHPVGPEDQHAQAITRDEHLAGAGSTQNDSVRGHLREAADQLHGRDYDAALASLTAARDDARAGNLQIGMRNPEPLVDVISRHIDRVTASQPAVRIAETGRQAPEID